MYVVYIIGALIALCIGGILLSLAFSDYANTSRGTASRMYAARALLKLSGLIPLAVLLWPLTLLGFMAVGVSNLIEDALGRDN